MGIAAAGTVVVVGIDQPGWDSPRVTWTAGRVSAGNLEAGAFLRSDYDLVINVNDAYLHGSQHWFPINEVAPWGYAPFFFVKRLLDNHPEAKVLIHCAAGACRSPLMAFCYTMSSGMSAEEVEACYGGNYIEQYLRKVKAKTIPNNLPLFYQTMREWPKYALMGILMKMGCDPREKSTRRRKSNR